MLVKTLTLSGLSLAELLVYLIDTNVISEIRKRSRANLGVIKFFEQISTISAPICLSAVTVGELRRGVELMRHRGDVEQAQLLEIWLDELLYSYSGKILEFDSLVAQVWGRLRVPNPENPIDKQIAATALVHQLVVVTRNTADFAGTGVEILNPFV
jgi:predicted nucleic acid-binding protein